MSDSASGMPPAGVRRGLLGLLRQLPAQISRLIRDELRVAQAEFSEKIKALGVGAGLIAGAAVAALYALGVLIAAGVLGLSTVLQPWLSALIVGVFLLLVALVLALVGRQKLKHGIPPIPTAAIDNVKADIRTVRGAGR